MAVLKSEMLLSLMTIPVESPYTSAIATSTRPVVAFWPLIGGILDRDAGGVRER